MAPSPSPSARSSRFSSVSSLFSISKTKTPAEKRKKLQDSDDAHRNAVMEQQGAKVEDSRGVRFENVKVGKRCAFVMVSTTGKEVHGKDIDIDDDTTWHGGQLSDQSMQNLPNAHDTEGSSVRDQSTEDIRSSRYGAGRPLGGAALTSTGAKRPTW